MNRMKAIVTGSLLGLSLLLGAGQSAYAVLAQWDNTWTPSAWTRGTTPQTLYAEWNIFSNDGGAGVGPGGPQFVDATPDVTNFGGGTYRLIELTGHVFRDGEGNIRRWSGITTPMSFQLDVTPPAGQGGPNLVRDFHLRLATLGPTTGTPPRHASNFTLNGVGGTYKHLFHASPAGGTHEVEALVSWLGVPHATSYELNWLVHHPTESVALDQLSIDVGQPVPLPAAAYLMASGLVGLAAMARRRKRAA
jgi:hypothetical protein